MQGWSCRLRSRIRCSTHGTGERITAGDIAALLAGVSRCYLPTVFACFRLRAAIARLTAATRPTSSSSLHASKWKRTWRLSPLQLLIGREESLAMRLAGMPFKPLMQSMLA